MMWSKALRFLIAVGMVSLMISCGPKTEKPGEESDADQMTTETGQQDTGAYSDVWDPDIQSDIQEDYVVDRPPEGITESIPELQAVYFDYDQFDLRPDALSALQENLDWLVANPDKKILIEGHCDERGSEEYNFSLGEKRAREVLGYLIRNNVAGDRVYIISYGEIRPAALGSNEEAWSQNRRAEFKVYTDL
jgi:peptidoglycan-associated lipoprotein